MFCALAPNHWTIFQSPVMSVSTFALQLGSWDTLFGVFGHHDTHLSLDTTYFLASLTYWDGVSQGLCVPSPKVAGNLCVKIIILSNAYRFLSCLQSQLKFSLSAFEIGELQKFLCAQKLGCWAITCLQTLSCLCLDSHSYCSAWRCTIKTLFHQIHPVLSSVGFITVSQKGWEAAIPGLQQGR